MLNKKDFKEIRRELQRFEIKREQEIQKSREIIQLSKQIIYAVHRNDMTHATSVIKEIFAKTRKLSPHHHDMDLNKVAFQEFVEAVCYYEFMRNKKIPTQISLKVDTEPYLSGLCDLTGELVRKAVDDIIRKKYKEVIEIRNLIDEIYGEFLHFNLRNSDLRKKSDAIKWNLQKVEDLVLQMNLKKLV